MPEEIFETFLQISDLHIGDFEANGSAFADPQWGLCQLYEGYFGHEFKNLRALDNFYEDLRRDEKAKLIVVGDLTASGSISQFGDAVSFLGGRLPPSKTGRGLASPNWASAGIPGNHDHWSGSNKVVGPPTSSLAETFPQMPYVKSLPRLPSGHTVTFAFLNSDADIEPRSLRRRFAQGDFTSELAKLDEILQDPLPNEVRVLVLHHSRKFGLGCWPLPVRLRMLRPSQQALDRFIVRNRIQILMTGHIHKHHFDVDSLPGGKGAKHRFMECRSGTATVRSEIPATWRNLWGQLPGWQPPKNGVIVHRIVRDDQGKFAWKAELYRRIPNGFGPLKPPEFRLLPL